MESAELTAAALRRFCSVAVTAALIRLPLAAEGSTADDVVSDGIDNRTPPTPVSASAAPLAASHKPNDQRTAGALVWEFGRVCELIGQMLTSFAVR